MKGTLVVKAQDAHQRPEESRMRAYGYVYGVALLRSRCGQRGV